MAHRTFVSAVSVLRHKDKRKLLTMCIDKENEGFEPIHTMRKETYANKHFTRRGTFSFCEDDSYWVIRLKKVR